MSPSNKHIVVGCTVLPDYCAKIGTLLLQNCHNTSLSYNPEFIQQGDIIRGFLNPDMVLIGEGSKEAGDLLENLYKNTCDNAPIIHRMSPSSAEICKLAVNCFITTKIAYANMIGDIADKTKGANKYHILEAVGSDGRIGNKCLRPGYGFGGPCFPRDNRALAGYAQSIDVEPIISEATDASNDCHTYSMAKEMEKTGEDFVFSDVSYKPDCPVPIIEESQKLKVAQMLAKDGKNVKICDKSDVIELVKAEYGTIFDYNIVI